jgi:tRNA A-37 threonylcarbamoyl transferase component Bud32
MTMIPDLTEFGYAICREHTITLIYRSSLPHLKDLAGIKGPLGKRSSLNGRSAIRIIEPDMVVRTLMHGGLFRHITGKNFISPARTIRELKVSAYLASKSIPTPEILAVRLLKKGHFYNIEVVSRLVSESTDLLTYLEAPRDDSMEVLENAGRLIRRIHGFGVYHADLHIKNLLLDGSKTLWLLDLDKAYQFDTLPGYLRWINVRRFIRSVKKWLGNGRIHLNDAWEGSFMKGYGEEIG